MDNDEILLSVIIPVFNEELTISTVIDRLKSVLKKEDFRWEIIVVDDFSTDRSLSLSLNKGVRVLSLKKHVGKGCALRVGFSKSLGTLVTTIDSDGSHRPEEIPLLLTPMLENKADLIIGSRYLMKTSTKIKRFNFLGVQLFNHLIHFLVKSKVSDSQSGYRIMKSEILQNMSLKSGGYEIESEMLVKTAKMGYKIKEVPICFEQRTYGKSSLDPIVDGFKILMSIILAYLQDR
ncbi:MAG TPA: glycosyltransferase family 2 protein [Candidatus Glassbacteria bacterium]|nr:glycosyltransferase family 2 protein [Candidatus Glassbacteria bacterium]